MAKTPAPSTTAKASTRSKTSTDDQDDDSGDDSDGNTMKGMIAAIAAAITQGFAAAVVAPAPIAPVAPPYMRPFSSSIDPYDTQSLELDTKEGKYQWAMITRKLDTWRILAVSVENADPLMDLFKDR